MAKYAGKGQKDLAARVASLEARGFGPFPRNPKHPHLYDRGAVLRAECEAGLSWLGYQKCHGEAVK